MPDDGITIRGLEGLIDRFDNLGGGMFSRNLMNEVGLKVIFFIQKRTSEGVDVDGRRFDEYSPKYKLFRQAKGHSGDRVNLFFTGSMLSAMTHSATDFEAKIFFQNTTDRSGARNPLKAFVLNEKRNFFALSAEEREDIEDMVNEHIAQLMRER